jgi:hypothetical protein
LRLLEVEHRLNSTRTRIVFLTALTHAAIAACLAKLKQLVGCHREIPHLACPWLDRVSIEHVLHGHSHTLPKVGATSIYAGTVYQVANEAPPVECRCSLTMRSLTTQLYNFSKRLSSEVDCVIMDEAGQLAVSCAALVLRSLSPRGRIVVSGDSEQLAPILSAQYPTLDTRIFGSILDCLMYSSRVVGEDDDESVPVDSISKEDGPLLPSQSEVVQLTENFRSVQCRRDNANC